jgi:hypothetical protein
MKRILIGLPILLLLLTGCHDTADKTAKLNETISSLQTENSILKEQLEHSTSDSNNTDTMYPKITKQLLNGFSWYEGSSVKIENQPRNMFKSNHLYTVRGDELDYEIVSKNENELVSIQDFKENTLVDINISTFIKVEYHYSNNDTHIEFYPLYYKFDGTLMIARHVDQSSTFDFISYPLQKIEY